MNKDIVHMREIASRLQINTSLCEFVLSNPRFGLWSGSPKKGQRHYGLGGLALHTREVIDLCLAHKKVLNAAISDVDIFLAGLYHDMGKMWDYEPLMDAESIPYQEWKSTSHKRLIHHISRSAIEWNKQAIKYSIDDEVTDNITHAILSHHGQREWGSPVAPKTKLAHLLHHCDAISARMNDADTFDYIK